MMLNQQAPVLANRQLPQPLCLSPEPDESLCGFILRVAVHNGCSGDEMAGWLELPKLTDAQNADPETAAFLLRVKRETLTGMGFEDDSTGWVQGHGIPIKHLHRVKRACCPDCLKEAAYYRRVWALRQVDVCPRHGKLLIDICSSCGSSLRWGKLSFLTSCGCGSELDEQGSNVPAVDTTGAAVIYLHCGLDTPGQGLSREFADLPLAALIELLFYLGRMDVVIAGGNPSHLHRAQMFTDRDVLNAGARVALRWPEAFDELACAVRRAYVGKSGLANEYGYLYRYVQRAQNKPTGVLLAEAFTAHLVKRGDISPSMLPLFLKAAAAKTEHFVSVPEIRDILGLGYRAYQTLSKGGGLFKSVANSRQGVSLYRMSEVERLGDKLRQHISLRQADRMLGFYQDKVLELIVAGVLERSADGVKTRHGRAAIEQFKVRDLLQRIMGYATAPAPAVPMDFRALHLAAAQRKTVGLPALIRSLLSEQVRGHVAFPERTGFNALVFETADVKELIERLGCPERSGKMRLSEVARKLRVDTKVVRQLTTLRLLPEPEQWSSTLLYEPNVVENFWEKFTYDNALAEALKTKSNFLRRKLSDYGIKPVAIITTQKGRTVSIYRRADVYNSSSASVVFGRYTFAAAAGGH